MPGEISTCFVRDVSHRTSNHLVTDAEGRVFEAKIYSDGGVLDIVLDEVSSADFVGSDLRYASGTPFESLGEDELRTARLPERRYITISHTQLCGLAELSERAAAMDVRFLVNCFVEEAGDAIWESGCTVGEIQGGSLLGIFGAPRYFVDHPLRAIRAACEQMAKMSRIHVEFLRQGKELPPCSCGLWTGDTLVGSVGNSYSQHYTALGKPVELARRLSELARPAKSFSPNTPSPTSCAFSRPAGSTSAPRTPRSPISATFSGWATRSPAAGKSEARRLSGRTRRPEQRRECRVLL